MADPPAAQAAAILWAVACTLAAISSVQRRFGPCRAARTSQGPSALHCSPPRLLTAWLALQAASYALAAPIVARDAVSERMRVGLGSVVVQLQLGAALAASALALLLLEPQNPWTRRAYLYLCTISVLGASAACAVLSARAAPRPPPRVCTWLALSGQMAALCAIVCAFVRMRIGAVPRNGTHESVPTKSGAGTRDVGESGQESAVTLAPVPWAGARAMLPRGGGGGGAGDRGRVGAGAGVGAGVGSGRGSDGGHSPHPRTSFAGRPAAWRPHLCGLVGSVLLLGAHALLAIALNLSDRVASAEADADIDNLVLAAAALAAAIALPLFAAAIGWLGQPEHFTVVPSAPICGYLCGGARARAGGGGGGGGKGDGEGDGAGGREWGKSSSAAPAVGVLERATTDAHILSSQGLFLSTPSVHSTRHSMRASDNSLRSSNSSVGSSSSNFRATPTPPPPPGASPVITCRGQANSSAVVECGGMTSTVAMMHASTAPKAYYKTHYGVENGMNMDRGAFSRCADGSIAACIFDGVTLGGRINAHAAQAFSSFTIGWLERHLHQVRASNIAEFTHNLFTRAQSHENNPGRVDRAKDAEGGAATGGYVLLRPKRLDTAAAASRKKRGRAARLRSAMSAPTAQAAPAPEADDDVFVMRGAVIGDVAVIILGGDAEQTRQVNDVHRATMQGRTDTGGQLNMCGDISGELSCFEHTITTSEILILATDGLTDNLRDDCMPELVHLLVRAPCFDEPQVRPCPWVVRQVGQSGEVEGHLPTPDELMQYVHASLSDATLQPLEDFGDVTPLAVTKRLTNYLHWVTGPKRHEEQRYYEALGELNICEHRVRESGDRDVDSADGATKQQVEDLSRELSNMRKSRRSSPVAGKTDDCLVLAIRPSLDTPAGSAKDVLQQMEARRLSATAEESANGGVTSASQTQEEGDNQRDVVVPASAVSIVDATSVV